MLRGGRDNVPKKLSGWTVSWSVQVTFWKENFMYGLSVGKLLLITTQEICAVLIEAEEFQDNFTSQWLKQINYSHINHTCQLDVLNLYRLVWS